MEYLKKVYASFSPFFIFFFFFSFSFFSKNLIAEKAKTGEDEAFCLEKVIQAFPNLLQVRDAELKERQHSGQQQHNHDAGATLDAAQNAEPFLVQKHEET